METNVRYGHDTDDPNKPRTEDVLIFEKVDFASMLLPSHLVDSLYLANFRRPSPIQLKAIPLARCGFDLIVQAKSGTGKTLVFGITALDVVKTDLPALQVLIIAPTREIAIQIKDVLCVIGRGIEGLNVKAFIGGLDIKKDKKEASNCHIAVVTPGRARQLLDIKALSVDNLRLLVLDEADKLMEPCFSKDISRLIKFTSGSKQIILASATLCESIHAFIEKHMNEPMRVTASGVKLLGDSERDDVPKVLIGVKQFVGEVQGSANIAQLLRKKADKLVTILKGMRFNQCIVFSNYQTRAESICNMLTGGGWPAVSICGKQEQNQRMSAISAFKEFRCRVLLSTDLTARGLDVHGVSLVVNLDVPYNGATYLHRMGRAGRFGSSGLVITLVSGDEEMKKFRNILFEIGGATMAVHKLPVNIGDISDTGSLDTVVALPPEDVNANVESTEEIVNMGTSENGLDVNSYKNNGAKGKQIDSTKNEVEGLCNALLESYLGPTRDLEFKSYDDLQSSRRAWERDSTSRKPAILKKNNLETENTLDKCATKFLARKKQLDTTTVDEEVLRTVSEKNWTDESRVSSEVDASSESEPSSEKSVTASEFIRVRSEKQSRKTVTVNLPQSARWSSASSDTTRGRHRKNTPRSCGRCCDHICENAQWNGGGDFHQSYGGSQGDTQFTAFNPSFNAYFSHLHNYNQFQRDSDANSQSQWYSHWEDQLKHIRFYVEYMEYWRNSYRNMFQHT